MFKNLRSTYLFMTPSEQVLPARDCVSISNSLIKHSGNPSPLAEAAYPYNLRTLSQSFCLFPDPSITLTFNNNCGVSFQPAVAHLRRLIRLHHHTLTLPKNIS